MYKKVNPMKISSKHAAYVSDVPESTIRDIMMIGLYKADSFPKTDSIMIPVKDIKEFIQDYPLLEEYLRARYRIIFNYLSQCLVNINNQMNNIEHVFFVIESKK